METEKIGFFKRVKLSIFNLEKYSIFANEKFSKALKYLILLLLIVTTVLAISATVSLNKETGKLINYIKSEEFPDFEIKDGKMTSSSILNSYDKEYDSRLIIDTTEDLSKEKIDSYKKEAKNSTISVIFLNDKVIYRFSSQDGDGLETTYNNLTSSLGIKDLKKSQLINDYLNEDSLFKFKVIMFIYAFISVLLLNILTLMEDVLVIGLFGWISSKIAKVSLTLGKAMALAIYSLTLSIILSTVYSVVYSYTGFEIKYFELMYMLIAYIYIVASIMMMKEGNRTAGEAVTVEGEVLKTGEEEEKKDEEKEEKKDKKKKLPDEKEKDKEEIPENEDKKPNGENNSKGEK